MVFLSLIAMAGLYIFINRVTLGGHYLINAIFPNALRLQAGADVRMAGVLIGKAKQIELTGDNKARVTMQINPEYDGRVPDDSVARITSGGVVSVGDYYIEIIPKKSRVAVKAGGYLRTEELPNLDNMIGQVEKILTGVQKTVNSMNGIVGDPKLRKCLRNTFENVETTTARTAELANQLQSLVAENRGQVASAMAQVNSAAENFSAVSSDIKAALEGGGLQQIQEALANANKASDNLAAATESLKRLAQDPSINADLKGTFHNINLATESLKNLAQDPGINADVKETFRNVNVATKSLKDLAQDPCVNADLRQAIHNANLASQGAVCVVDKLNRILGDNKPACPNAKPTLGKGLMTDAFALGATGDFRLDVDYIWPRPGKDFYRFGFFDLGEDTRVNLQAGKVIDKRSSVRYGLYASNIGLGYDRRTFGGLIWQTDLFRPNDVSLETKLRYDPNKNWGAWLGFQDLFYNGRMLVGAEYRK